MDNDLDLDYLSEELPGFGDEVTQGPVDAQDLMSTLEADYLENELPIDGEGRIVRAFEREGEEDDLFTGLIEVETDDVSSESLSELVDAALAEEYPEAYAEAGKVSAGLDGIGLEALDPDTLSPGGADGAATDVIALADAEQDLLLVESVKESTKAQEVAQAKADKAAAKPPKAKKNKTKRAKSTKRSATNASKTEAAAGTRASASAASQHLQRSFDATDLVSAQEKLGALLDVADVPTVSLLGLAAERCLTYLPECSSVTLTAWQEEGEEPVPVWTLPRAVSLRQVLTSSAPPAHSERPGLRVGDLSGLGLEYVSLNYEGLWLSLLRLGPDPLQPERSRGVLGLNGEVGLRSGAAFLGAVALRLEAPLSLAV